MTRIDSILLLVLAFYAFLGYRRGFLAVALDWVGLGLSLMVALWLTPVAAEWLTANRHMLPLLARILAFLGLLVGTRLAWGIAAILVLRRISMKWHQSVPNHVAGILPGLLQGIVIIAAVLAPLAALPVSWAPRAEIAASPLASTALRWGMMAQTEIREWMGGTVRDLIAFRPPPLKEDETVELPFHAPHAVVDPQAEAKMLHLVNEERERHGLLPVRMDEHLRAVARRHSQDMLARGYFSHRSPEGRDPFDRLQGAGVHYMAAGENLAFAPDVATAHAGLMNSPGHRANILRRSFGHVGIGALQARPYGVMFSQEYTN